MINKWIVLLLLLMQISLQAVQQTQENFEPIIELDQQIPIQQPLRTDNQLTLNQSTFSNSTVQSQKFIRRPLAFDLQTLELYRYQVMMVGIIFLYIIHYFWGKNKNALLIEKFYRNTHEYFHQNFAHIGFSKTHGQDPFVAQSAHQMMFYASGRDNIDYLQMNFSFRKRQDIIYFYLYQILYPSKDLITVDIPVKCNHMIVFCLSTKKGLKLLSDNSLDLNKLTSFIQLKALQNYQILGQSTDVIDFIFTQQIIKKINSLQGLLHSIHFTDQKIFSQQSGHLRAVLNASFNKPQQYQSAFQNRIINIKISASTKQKLTKSRQIFYASKQKQQLQKHKQQLKKQKQQKKRKQQAWLRSLPPQKQKRQDQKRKRKQMNKLMKGKVMKTM